MLRAFLIVWTVVAGLAAAGLLYIVGWRPQTTVVAERLTSPSGAGATSAMTASTPPPSGTPAPATGSSGMPSGRAATAPAGTGQGNTASTTLPAGSPGAVPNSTVSPDAPASTGSIGPAPARSPTRTVRRVDEPRPLASAPTASEMTSKPGRDARPVAPEGKPAEPSAGAAGIEEPPKPAPSSRLAASSPRAPVTAESRANDAFGETSQGSPAADQQNTPIPPVRPDSHVTTAAPMSPPLFSEPEQKRSSPKRDVAAVSTRHVAPPLESSEAASQRAVPDVPNRTLKQRAKAARTQTARAMEPPNETTRAAAQAERPPRLKTAQTAQTRRSLRRQARTAQRTQVARGGGRPGGLEQLMDEFSRSGADFLHERTTRVGTRYLVERTTRHGTQYFYEQSVR